ncbi:SGNH/GDSL hydrolase family protein [Paenibacillus contaminans]|uniref:SGNH hydrolase-type esterase domain-containing protein n=1 Tax=Paenibacillus contaminans TaxID=450362 RepID=A0A329M921_9BACL|nr:SGNH/GDSL hydrolase family protein [Paenibacillus contaminans]RAV16659.1 hypothetical protein DQG23_27865 [Paenibacillus contaminans]
MITWIPVTKERFTISGLPWLHEHESRFIRFPQRAQASIPENVWLLSQMPSGGRIRFTSDTTSLQIRAAHHHAPQMIDMPPLGHSGMDLYAGEPGQMKYWGTSVPQMTGQPYEYMFFKDIASKDREFTLYLPAYNDLVTLEIGIDRKAKLGQPSPYAANAPVVFYGSSITQGACASRPGNGYVSMISRILHIDIVNMGFNGSGRGELSVCKLLSEINSACYVLDYHVNLPSAAQLADVYAPFYRKLRETKTDTPIVMISPLCFSSERYDSGKAELYGNMRRTIRGVYEEAVCSGDSNVYFADGSELIGLDEEGLYVDGLHPNDRGFAQIADRLAPVLKQNLFQS